MSYSYRFTKQNWKSSFNLQVTIKTENDIFLQNCNMIIENSYCRSLNIGKMFFQCVLLNITILYFAFYSKQSEFFKYFDYIN